MREYRLIASFGLVMEPPELWTSRAAKKWQDRVPRVERLDQGDAWVVPGGEPAPFGWSACAGRRPDQVEEWCGIDEVNPGAFDAAARIAELDLDGVDAEVLFPMQGPEFASADADPDFHLAMVQLYNDFVAEFAGTDPSRLGACAVLPEVGIDAAVAEVERLAAKPGIVGWLLKTYPHGDSTLKPDDDAVWSVIEQTGRPVAIHVGLRTPFPVNPSAQALPGAMNLRDAPGRMLEIIFSGVLERFPRLQFFFAEIGCGWQPYFSEISDDNYLRRTRQDPGDMWTTPVIPKLPSEYMKERFPASFTSDPYAVQNRAAVGINRMLWAGAYPAIASDWPHSWKTINAAFADVPDDERHALLAGNAQRLFGFGSGGQRNTK